MYRGLTEAEVEGALGHLDTADLPPVTIAALRLADRLSDVRPHIDAEFYAELRQALDDDEILELGAALSIASGWQRFIEAFGLRPDAWTDTTPLPSLFPDRTSGWLYVMTPGLQRLASTIAGTTSPACRQ